MKCLKIKASEVEKAKENHVSFEEVIDWIHYAKLVNAIPVR